MTRIHQSPDPERHTDSDDHGSGPLPGEHVWRHDLPDNAQLSGFGRCGRHGPAVVFIHGFRSHCDGGKARRLSRAAGDLGCHWLRYDQRGCGASGGDFRRFTISGAVEDATRVLDALDESSYILVGSSLGALIALHVALARRHRVDGLVLIAPALRFTAHFIHAHLDATDLDRWRQRGYRWFPDLYAGGCYRLNHDFCADALKYGEPPDRLPCPVRALHGTRDELLPWQDTRDWIEKLNCPGRALEIIDGGDHRLTEWSDTIARQLESLLHEVRQSCA